MWQREEKLSLFYNNLTTELMALFSITSYPNPFKAIHTLKKTHKVTHSLCRQTKNKISVQRKTILDREKEMEKEKGCV